MRVGKFKQIIDKAVGEDNRIVIEKESLYQGNAFRLKNVKNLRSAINAISEQGWNE